MKLTEKEIFKRLNKEFDLKIINDDFGKRYICYTKGEDKNDDNIEIITGYYTNTKSYELFSQSIDNIFVSKEESLKYLEKQVLSQKDFKNKFKTGDKVVTDTTFYTKIQGMFFGDRTYRYKLDHNNNEYYDEKNIRKPTAKEIKQFYN